MPLYLKFTFIFIPICLLLDQIIFKTVSYDIQNGCQSYWFFVWTSFPNVILNLLRAINFDFLKSFWRDSEHSGFI